MVVGVRGCEVGGEGYVNGFDLEQLAKPRVQENVRKRKKGGEGGKEGAEGRREER